MAVSKFLCGFRLQRGYILVRIESIYYLRDDGTEAEPSDQGGDEEQEEQGDHAARVLEHYVSWGEFRDFYS